MTSVETIQEEDTKTAIVMRPPSKFNVVLYNDDSTTVEFVVLILISIFHKTLEEAGMLTMNIHERGSGIAGTYNHEIAVQKKEETISVARLNGFPLVCELKEA